MRNEAGSIKATRKGIANMFAKFYKDLHKPTMILKTMNKTDTSQNSP